MALSDRERSILELERTWWLEPVSKEQQIRARLELSSARYYQLLNDLIDSQDALAYDPLVVRRLRKGRERRRRTRFEGRPASEPPRR